MKKIVIIMLAVTMVLGMQCIGVAAQDDLVGTVYSDEAFGDYRDGAMTPDGTGSYNIDFVITGETAPRYAVDVVTSGLEFTFETDLVWDVNTLDYVATDATAVTAPTAPSFTISNRSNMPVKITLTDAESAAANAAGISLSFAKASMTLSATQPKATDPVSEVFTGAWACANSDWAAAYGILKGYAVADRVTVATVTITVSAPTP